MGGAVDRHTDGCPLHVNPGWIRHDTHPADEVLPVSQVYEPTITPSPQIGMQTPWELAEYPASAQVRHWFADLQVAQVALHA